jgi:hypothetical protein
MKLTGVRNAWKHLVPATKCDVKKILMKISEVAAFVGNVDTAVQNISTQVAKIGTEVQALKDSLSDAQIPADAQTKLESLSTHISAVADALKQVDDIIPDNPTPTP